MTSRCRRPPRKQTPPSTNSLCTHQRATEEYCRVSRPRQMGNPQPRDLHAAAHGGTGLVKTRDTAELPDDKLSVMVLEQMLSAPDYLACNHVCHRDVKPDN